MEHEVEIAMNVVAMLLPVVEAAPRTPLLRLASSSFNCGSIDLQMWKRSGLEDWKRNQA
ncbi:hypothetical protein OG933_15170 [Streptomyces sp. NBC_00016]|uniref:hypothetical protein n=1 Tax=Streptomyces sp. NBC_00016 TaxID=2975622 RepID=UPI0032517C8C